MKQNAPMREHRGGEEITTVCDSNSTPPTISAQAQLPDRARLHDALLTLACDLYSLEYDAEHADTPARRKKLSRDLRQIEDRIEKLADNLKGKS